MSMTHQVILLAPKENALEIYQSVYNAIYKYCSELRKEVVARHQVENWLLLPPEIANWHRLPIVRSYGFEHFNIDFANGANRQLFVYKIGEKSSYDDDLGEGNKFGFSINAWGRNQEIIEIVKAAVASYGTVHELLNDVVVEK